MSTESNKRLLQQVYAELAQGNSAPLLHCLADDVRWTVSGSTAWSGCYVGKPAVLEQLLRPLGQRLAGRYRAHALRFIAEGDEVMVEARGEAVTRAGLPYNNRYCFIYRLANGKVRELTEYGDTALIEAALGSRPPAGPAG